MMCLKNERATESIGLSLDVTGRLTTFEIQLFSIFGQNDSCFFMVIIYKRFLHTKFEGKIFLVFSTSTMHMIKY